MSVLDFVRTYSIDSEHLQEARALFQCPSVLWEKHGYSIAGVEQNIEKNYGGREPSVSSSFSEVYLNLSFNMVADALNSYYEEFPTSLATRFLPIRLNRYQKGQSMQEHWDGIHTIFDGSRRGVPILSIVGLVNKPKAGGLFYIKPPQGPPREFLTEEGTIVVFPSTFIYNHEVTTVEEGTRDSFVSWTFY
jgi:predicted 2-oxoglutarate/Fe(II)-dependent dioxygenase YbiX